MPTVLTLPRAAPLPSPGPISGPAARSAAHIELLKPEYHRDDPGIFARVANWVLDRLGSLVAGVTTVGGLAILVVALLIAGLVGIAVWRAGPLHRGVRGPERFE